MSMVSSGGVRARFQLALFGRSLAIAIIAALAALAPRAQAFDFQDGRLQIHGYFEATDPRHRRGLLVVRQHGPRAVVQHPQRRNGVRLRTGRLGPVRRALRLRARRRPLRLRVDARVRHVPVGECLRQSRRAASRLQDRRPPQRLLRAGLHRQPGQLLVGTRARQNTELGRFTALKYAPVVDPRTGIDSARAGQREPAPPGAHRPDRRPRRPLRDRGCERDLRGERPRPDRRRSHHRRVHARSTTTRRTSTSAASSNCDFGSRKIPGGANGIANQVIGPIDPRCDIQPEGALRFRPNPFNTGDPNPLVVNPADRRSCPRSAARRTPGASGVRTAPHGSTPEGRVAGRLLLEPGVPQLPAAATRTTSSTRTSAKPS